MAIISDAQLDKFSALGEKLALKDSCEILRDSSADSDDRGGYEGITWPTVATVACMVMDGSGSTRPKQFVEADRLKGRITQSILLPRKTDVLESDRIRVNGTDTYQIEEIEEPTSYEVFRRVQVWREA